MSLEAGWGANKQTDKLTSPVFYKTSSPLGPLSKKGPDYNREVKTPLYEAKTRG